MGKYKCTNCDRGMLAPNTQQDVQLLLSVLNEVEWLVCLFHSDSYIIIDQETNRGGHLLNKNIGEI